MPVLFFLYNVIFLSGILYQSPVYPAIRINVGHISSKKGDILVALYNSDKGFPGKKTGVIRTAKGIVQNGRSLIVIDDVAPGTYAVALFHDTNDDGKLNFNFLGIPKEGYGFSNNAWNMFSAPSFKQSAFVHNKETDIEIRMRY